MSSPARVHGGNAQTSTTAPRYLLVLKAEVAVDVVAVVAMGSEKEYRVRESVDNKMDADQPLGLSRRPAHKFRRLTLVLRQPSPASKAMND